MAASKPTPGSAPQGVDTKHLSPQSGTGGRSLRLIEGVLYDAALPPSPIGFVAEGRLGPCRLDVETARRERAALHVVAIGRDATPEDIVGGISQEVMEAFSDELERDEALAHVDLLLEVLLPRMEAVR